MAAAIILGSGAGRRMGGDKPKVFLPLDGKPVIRHSLERFAASPGVHSIVLTVPPGALDAGRTICADLGLSVTVIEGGPTRQESVLIALSQLPSDTRMVIIHDGARPLTPPELIVSVLEGAREHGACVPTVESSETVKLVRGGRVVETLNRDEIHTVQTPQAFYYEVILEAHRHAHERKWRATDDAALVEKMGRPVTAVPGARANIKITYPEDLKIAELLLRE